MSAAEFGDFMMKEMGKWERVVKEGGIKRSERAALTDPTERGEIGKLAAQWTPRSSLRSCGPRPMRADGVSHETRASDNKDFWAGVMLIATGAATMFIARGYAFGTTLRMGPGYFPTVLGGILILFGLYLLFSRPAQQRKDRRAPGRCARWSCCRWRSCCSAC